MISLSRLTIIKAFREAKRLKKYVFVSFAREDSIGRGALNYKTVLKEYRKLIKKQWNITEISLDMKGA